MRSVALGLDLHESFFDRKIDQQHHNLRLLSYPSVRTKLLSQEGQARAGAHSGMLAFVFGVRTDTYLVSADYGTITLLFQDSVRKYARFPVRILIGVVSGRRITSSKPTHPTLSACGSYRTSRFRSTVFGQSTDDDV